MWRQLPNERNTNIAWRQYDLPRDTLVYKNISTHKWKWETYVNVFLMITKEFFYLTLAALNLRKAIFFKNLSNLFFCFRDFLSFNAQFNTAKFSLIVQGGFLILQLTTTCKKWTKDVVQNFWIINRRISHQKYFKFFDCKSKWEKDQEQIASKMVFMF